MISNKNTCLGFTLIELMVTLAIAAILLMVAIPSMTTYKRNAELTSATNTLLGSINAARSEAMKRGMNAMVVPTNNGTDWNAGWIVFVYKFVAGRTPAYAYDATYDTLISSQASLPSYVSISASGTAGSSAPYVMFDASGFGKTKGEAGMVTNFTFNIARNDVAGAEIFTQTRRIKASRIGRVRVCKPISATDSKCLAAAD